LGHIEVWDTQVIPGGDVVDLDSAHNDDAADEFERGLHCARCKEFIRDENGSPCDYTNIPKLLTTGRLKLATDAA
jgi:hypothetical protein